MLNRKMVGFVSFALVIVAQPRLPLQTHGLGYGYGLCAGRLGNMVNGFVGKQLVERRSQCGLGQRHAG
jgi:hypothetical protein